ncbi:MAG TPA: EVE domain-containing protein [Longimicrobiaceae bacterium]|nr:EVE domain-containing protein [Longimicrobiaceae bacterium]
MSAGQRDADEGPRFWVGVVSAEHVERGVGGGYAQLCHGKAAPLRRMRGGDWLIYYSPAEKMRGGQPVQAFTAIGRVENGPAYEFDMGGGFVPFRRDVRYLGCTAAPIRPLLADLTFLPDKSRWGYAFRFGHLQIPRDDFLRIAAAMGVDPEPIAQPEHCESIARAEDGESAQAADPETVRQLRDPQSVAPVTIPASVRRTRDRKTIAQTELAMEAAHG